MAYSSILGGERAPTQPSGKSADLLGPSDSSDSGSDSIGELGADDLASDSDRAGTGDRASAEPQTGHAGADILPDRVVRLGGGEPFNDAEVGGALDLTDLDEAQEGEEGESL